MSATLQIADYGFADFPNVGHARAVNAKSRAVATAEKQGFASLSPTIATCDAIAVLHFRFLVQEIK
jgi:GTPase involved in cell partitioning and DNA repair